MRGGDDILPKRREEVLSEINRLRQMVGSVEVRAPDGATIMVDDVERGTAPLVGKLTITAGIEHRINAMLDGKQIDEKVFKIRGGDVLTVDLGNDADPQGGSLGNTKLNPADNSASPATVPKDSGSGLSPLVITGSVTTALGMATIISGIVTGIMTKNMDDELKKDCPDGVCPKSKINDKDKMETMRTGTNVLLITGASVTAIGATLLIVGLVKKNKKASETVLAPAVYSQGFGMQIQWRF